MNCQVFRSEGEILEPAFATATVVIYLFIYFYFWGYLDELNDNGPQKSAEMHGSWLFNFIEFFNELNDNDKSLSFNSLLPPIHQ